MAKTIIIVGHTEIDGYGNMQVTDKEGNVIKIAAKRSQLFPLFQQGQAVELDWQSYMNKDYVADAKLIAGELPPQPEPLPPTKVAPIGQETGMWYKEAGELYRMWKTHPETMPDKPWAKALVTAYYAKLFSVLGITGEEEP